MQNGECPRQMQNIFHYDRRGDAFVVDFRHTGPVRGKRYDYKIVCQIPTNIGDPIGRLILTRLTGKKYVPTGPLRLLSEDRTRDYRRLATPDVAAIAADSSFPCLSFLAILPLMYLVYLLVRFVRHRRATQSRERSKLIEHGYSEAFDVEEVEH